MNQEYWRKQPVGKPLFADSLWERPERKTGKIVLVGGNKNGFAAVTAAYAVAQEMKIASVKVILPDALKTRVPNGILDIVFAPSNPSGGLASDAIDVLNAAAQLADNVVLIGDSGANAETAALFENFIAANPETNFTITRDALDLLINASENILQNSRTQLVLGLSQFQKITRAVYYPRVITFSQGASQIAETLHKFTITYPMALTLWHASQLFFAQNGKVFSQDFAQPARVWNGEIAMRGAIWRTWQSDAAKAVLDSWTEL